MVLAAALAAGDAGRALRRKDAWREGRWFIRALFGAATLLLLAELLAWEGEFSAHSEAWYSPYNLVPLVSRAALGALLVAGLFRGPPGRARWVVLAGAALYLATDLLYHLQEESTGFLLQELGFYAGYWLMALGAYWPGPADDKV